MLTKSLVKKQLGKFPENFSLDELVEELILIQKVEQGLLDSKEGRMISEKELDEESEKWFQ